MRVTDNMTEQQVCSMLPPTMNRGLGNFALEIIGIIFTEPQPRILMNSDQRGMGYVDLEIESGMGIQSVSFYRHSALHSGDKLNFKLTIYSADTGRGNASIALMSPDQWVLMTVENLVCEYSGDVYLESVPGASGFMIYGYGYDFLNYVTSLLNFVVSNYR